MLILTRKIGETINISEDITVQILGNKGNQVRIGTAAPDDVVLIRPELLVIQGEPVTG